MVNHALDKARPLALDTPRSIWESYQKARWGWHIVVPLGLAGVAGGFLSWAWTMLDQNEYGVALLLVFFFLVVGIGAAIAIPRRTLKAVAILSVVVITGFSALKTLRERGDKPWTTVFKARAVSVPAPSPSPSPTAIAQPSLPPPQIASAESVVQPTPVSKPSVKRKVRTSKLSPAELRERQEILRALGSKKPERAHVATQQTVERITKEQIKTALAKRRTKTGVELIVLEVRRRGIVFVLTPEIDQELREFAKQHGNTSIDGLIAALNELSFMPRLESLRSEDGVLLSLIKGVQVKSKFDELQMLDTLMKKAGYSGPILMSDLVITNDLASKDSIRVGTSGFSDTKSQQVNPGYQYIFPNGENITKAYIFSISDVTVHISYRVAGDQTLPFGDWIRSDEAKQLVKQMTGEVEKLADEGRVMDLTDYDNALKSFRAWIDKCSVALGRIDIQMRRFNKRTNYKFEWDKNDWNFEIFGDGDRKKEMFRLGVNTAIAELDLLKANINTETSPDLDSFRRP